MAHDLPSWPEMGDMIADATALLLKPTVDLLPVRYSLCGKLGDSNPPMNGTPPRIELQGKKKMKY
jgi:hypothetical protein